MIALHGALDLLLLIALHQDQAVEILVITCLDQNSSLHHDNPTGIGLGKLIDQVSLALKNVRMHQLIERCQTLGLPKDFGGQAFPINGSIGVEDTLPELPDHIRVSLTAGEQHFVAELIGLNQVTAQVRQGLPDESLAAGEAPGKTYF